MRFSETTDPRNKKQMKITHFSHNLRKSRKHIEGTFIEELCFIPGKEILRRFSVYIKQKDTVVACASGLIFNLETFCDKDHNSELYKKCENLGDIFETSLDVLWDHLDIDLKSIKRKDPFFGLESKFVCFEHIFVHPFYRRQGYGSCLIRAIKKKYGKNLNFILSDQCFFVEDLNSLKIKDRKIDINTFRSIVKRAYNNNHKNENNDEFIFTIFPMDYSISEVYVHKDYGDLFYFCIFHQKLMKYSV